MNLVNKNVQQFHKQLTFSLYSCFLWGFAAHGMTFFNKYSTHDDAFLFDLCGTFSSGRWMLGELGSLYTKIFGSWYYSTPLFNGIVSLLAVSFLCAFLLNLFEIESTILKFSLCGVLVVFPYVTSLFGFMFTAPYYMIGSTMSVLGALLICKYRKHYIFFCGILLMSCSVGVYQANIPICVSLLLMGMIKQLFDTETLSLRKAGSYSLYYGGACIALLVFYLLINKIELSLHQVELSSYQGINSFGLTTPKGYLSRTITAYREFLFPTRDRSAYMYPVHTRRYYRIACLFVGLLSLRELKLSFKKDLKTGLFLLILLALLPIAFNFIYIMTEQVYSMMMYGEAFFFVYLIWLCTRFHSSNKTKENAVKWTVSILLLLICLVYCRFDNICYLKAEFEQEQVKSYYTTLISRIQSIPDYNDDYPVVYINEFDKQPPTGMGTPDTEIVYLVPYGNDFDVNNYNWRQVMRNWCGYDPYVLDATPFMSKDEIVSMPCYPDDGSIQVFDKTIVIKFADSVNDRVPA